MGVTGAAGPTGAKGADGDTGPTGIGITGPTGTAATNTSDSITDIDFDSYGNINLSFNSDPTLLSSRVAFVNGGNAAVAPLTLGTNNGNNLNIETDNTTRLTVLSTGQIGVNQPTPTSGMEINTSMAIAIKTATGNYIASALDHVILGNPSGGTITITLPSAVGITGRKYIIKNSDASGGTVQINGGGTNIDGATSQSLSTAYESIEVVSDGSNWFIISRI